MCKVGLSDRLVFIYSFIIFKKMATKAKRKPYQRKIHGSMYFPMEFKGSDDEHIRQSTYKGLFATQLGQQIVYSQRRYYNVNYIFAFTTTANRQNTM